MPVLPISKAACSSIVMISVSNIFLSYKIMAIVIRMYNIPGIRDMSNKIIVEEDFVSCLQ